MRSLPHRVVRAGLCASLGAIASIAAAAGTGTVAGTAAATAATPAPATAAARAATPAPATAAATAAPGTAAAPAAPGTAEEAPASAAPGAASSASLELTVVNGATKAPLPEQGVRIAVFPAGGAPPSSFDAKTDASGKCSFSLGAAPVGSAVLATTDFGGARFHSEPAASPATGALPMVLEVYEPTTAPEGLAFVAPSRIGLHPYERPMKDFSEEIEVMVRVTVELVVENRTSKAFFPPGNGLEFPFPAGAIEPDVPASSLWMELVPTGARWRDYFPPGRTAIGFEYSVPPDGDGATVDIALPFAATDVELITVLTRPGTTLEGAGFGPTEPATVTNGEGSTPVLRAVAAALPAGSVRVGLGGITTKFQLAGWIAVVFGALSILVAVSLVLIGGDGAAAPVRSETQLRTRRRRLLEDLCRIEEGRAGGKIQPDRYQSARGDLLARIAALDRQIEA